MLAKTSITDSTSNIFYQANETTIISKILITNIRATEQIIRIHILDTSETIIDNTNIGYISNVGINTTITIEGLTLAPGQKLAYSIDTADINPINIVLFGMTR